MNYPIEGLLDNNSVFFSNLYNSFKPTSNCSTSIDLHLDLPIVRTQHSSIPISKYQQ